MEWMIAVSFGEIFLKGKNRNIFYKQAIDNIKRNIRDIKHGNIYTESSKLYIEADRQDFDKLKENILKVFGISYLAYVLKTNKDLDSIYDATKEVVQSSYADNNYTFKVESRRTDKTFKLKSPELSAKIGGFMLRDFANLRVNVHNPDFKIYIDVKENVYVYADRFEGLGGLPIGSSGKGLLLLSGGIDSPVAGFMVAKRGMKIDCLHFHSYPFTSKRALQKAIDLGEILSAYTGKMTIYSINLADIYKEINQNCDRRETTILSRRFMMRIANKIAESKEYQALITGESLGQVASQTIESISVINDSSERPILRPLVAMDKKDIIDISYKIGSYEKSIEPYDDCCSIFAPDSPLTKPKLKYIKMSEEKLDIEKLENEAIDKIEIIEISWQSYQIEVIYMSRPLS